MIRNYIKLCNKKFLKFGLETSETVIKRYLFVPHQSILTPEYYNTKLLTVYNSHYNVRSIRCKSKNSKKQDTDSDSEPHEKDFSDEIQDKNTKVLNISTTSLRVDAILKSALGIARNKIETLFYESKIRVNGDKILKKSATVQIGDEVDLLKGPDLKNPNFINVARVEILAVKPNEDTISVKIRRYKSLTIESY